MSTSDRYVTEGSRSFDPIAIVAGIIQTIIYADFGYIVSVAPPYLCATSLIMRPLPLLWSFWPTVRYKVSRQESTALCLSLMHFLSTEYSVAKSSSCQHRRQPALPLSLSIEKCNRTTLVIDSTGSLFPTAMLNRIQMSQI